MSLDSSNMRVNNRKVSESTSADAAAEDRKIHRPPPRRDFKKLLDDDGRQNEDEKKAKKKKTSSASEAGEEVEGEVDPLDPTQRKPAAQPFDLSREGGDKGDQSGTKESPFAMFKKQSTAGRGGDESAAWQASVGYAEKEVAAGKGKKGDRTATDAYSEPQAELNAVNPYGTQSQQVVAIGARESPIAAHGLSPELKLLIEHVTKSLQQIESQGKTETIVVVDNPPIFKGVQVVLTAYATAKKEYNLAFENLTQAAKNLIDANIASLRSTLENQGYANAIHIITTTTKIEHPIVKPEGRSGSENRDERGQREDDGGEKKQKR